MKTQNKNLSVLQRFPALGLLLIVGVLGLNAVLMPLAEADKFDEQIKAIQAETRQKKQAQYQLSIQALDLNDKINKLQEQINTLQEQINANQAKAEDLQKQIIAAEEELARQKRLLGENIKAMYLEGEISTIEMLASSKDLSDFIDKQQYRNAVKDKIRSTVEKITALKLQLKEQKIQVENLIAEQQAAQAQLDAQRAEQNHLLSLNQSQRAVIDQEIKANAGRIAELQKQQIAENARLFNGRIPAGIPGGGGYQWGDAICMHPGWADPPCGQYDWGYPGFGIYDRWGYGYRNCTSYVAWKINERTGHMISGLGHAKAWPFTVGSRAEVSYGKGARVGDAAVSTGGEYGHVMYVEAVEGDTVFVSDYNLGGDGYYRPARARSMAGLYYIHF